MLVKRCDNALEREMAIAESIRDVASELRLLEIADLIAFVRLEQFANLESIVNSSTELYFRPGSLVFGFAADIQVEWGEVPSVALDMQFQYDGIVVYFRLMLEDATAGVDITYVSFGANSSTDPCDNTGRLRAVLSDCRRPPRSLRLPVLN